MNLKNEQDIKIQTTFIYALIDPRTNAIRYVGKANNPQARFRVHVSPRGKTYAQCWIRQLYKGGMRPKLIILEEIPQIFWRQREAWWIDFHKRRGCRLTNLIPGGIGPRSGRKPSKETRLKMSAARKGRKHDEEWCKALSESHKGLGLGQKLSGAHRKAISNGLKGHIVSKETREKLSETHKKIPPTQESLDAAHKANIGNTYRKGKHHTEETKQKISDGNKHFQKNKHENL